MKILQVISHYVPAISFGGALQVAHQLGRALANQGHEVTVCCTNMCNPQTDLAVPVGRPVTIDRVQVFYEQVRVPRYWGFSPSLARRVFYEASRTDVVLTHFHFQFASLIGGWNARFWGKPLLVFTHGSLNRSGMVARHNALKRFYIKFCEGGNFTRANFVVYNSAREFEQSVQFKQNHLIVHNAVDDELFEKPIARGEFRAGYPGIADRFLFLYVGRVARGKGLFILVQAFSETVKMGWDAHLAIVGGDERGFLRRLEKLVGDLGISERVTFTGILDGAHKVAAFKDADTFVLPSRSEGTSIVTLEAMHMKLPVIITDRVGLSDLVVSENCGLVVSYDRRAVRDGLIKMMKSDDRAKIGKNGLHAARKMSSWQKIANDLVESIIRMQSVERQ